MKGPSKIDFSSSFIEYKYSPVTQTLIQHFHRKGLIIVNRGKEVIKSVDDACIRSA
jgi:hypothetical protein